MKNLVKEYIQSGKSFADLKNEFGISGNEFENLICLNYSQIDSPKTAPIVRQCRGLVIDRDTLDIVHYPFYRFFNLDEVVEERTRFNWTKAVALEKIDGSLFGVFNYNGAWYITTRSQIGGGNNAGSGLKTVTFGELFDEAIGMPRDTFFTQLDATLDYTFELAGPINKIITPYEETHLYLIAVRDKLKDFHELPVRDFVDNMPPCVRFPKQWSIMDENGEFIGFNELKAKANGLEKPTDEGFVVVDYSPASYDENFGFWPRLKVKNSAYVELHRLRGEDNVMHWENILSVIWNGEKDEVLANLPTLKEYFDEVESKLHVFERNVDEVVNALRTFFDMPLEERRQAENKKAFAITINSSSALRHYSKLLFIMYNKGKTLREAVDELNGKNENFFKALWNQYLNN